MFNRISTDSRARAGLSAVLILAALLRLAVILPTLGQIDDPDNYLILARSLIEGRGYQMIGRPTAFRPPLYPLLLAPFSTLPTWSLARVVAGLHISMGLATVALTYGAARRWGYSYPRALMAAVVVAADPVLSAQGRSVMTETLAALLVAAILAAVAGGGMKAAFVGGLMSGLASLCRPSLLAASTLVAAAALGFGPGAVPTRLKRSAAFAVATFLVLAPWAWRNARAIGEPVWTTTHGGYTLALANNPVYYAEVVDGPPGAVWTGPNQERWFEETHQASLGISEPEADRRLTREAIRFMAEHPRAFARASCARLSRFWGIAPASLVYSRGLRVATAVWTAPLWLALVAGLLRRSLWQWPSAAAPAILLAMTIVHSVFWTDMRMRAPIVPAIALVASGAAATRRRTGIDSAATAVEPENADRKKIQNLHGF